VIAVHDVIEHTLRLLYFMTPAYVANMAPPFVRFWKGWNRPIHVGLFGTHKTVVGEPPRESRRPFGLSHATCFCSAAFA
jgi:hypothetical protein